MATIQTVSKNLTVLTTLHLERAALVADLQAQIDALQAEINLKTQNVNAQIKKLEVKVRDQALKAGPGTIKGDGLQAVVYTTKSWDSAMLEEMAQEVPFILEAHKQKVVVQIKKVGGGK